MDLFSNWNDRLWFSYLKKYDIDLLYGYEVIGVPSAKVLSLFFRKPFVSRFQGTMLMPKMDTWLWQIKHWHHLIGLKINADLTIMTNDGTEGDMVLKLLNRDMNKVKFWINGVDKVTNERNIGKSLKVKLGIDKNTRTILSVSRHSAMEKSRPYHFVNEAYS